MRKLFTRELIFLSICAAIAAAYMGLGYLLAPEIPVESKIIRVTSVKEITDSISTKDNAIDLRNAFFSAWVRWGMFAGVGLVIAISIFRALPNRRQVTETKVKKSPARRKYSPPLMSKQAWFYLMASIFLVFVLVTLLSMGFSR